MPTSRASPTRRELPAASARDRVIDAAPLLAGVLTSLWLAGLVSGASAQAPLEADSARSMRAGERADGVAAIVGGYSGGRGVAIILRSDVDLVARLRLAGEIGAGAASAGVPEELSAAALDTIFGEVLIAREAERVRIRPADDAAIARELARLEAEAGGAETVAALLAALGATEEELRDLAARRALVAAFLEANLESSSVVTTAEVERVYASGDHPFRDRELSEVEAELRALIARRNIERAIRRWISVLRARTPYRILAHYGS
jgi:hypothetical protein